MLSKLVLKLKQKDDDIKFSVNMASAFHGALMECIDSDYASDLHNNIVNPYSQFISLDGEYIFWHICTTSKESYERLISPFLENAFEEIPLKYHQTQFRIEKANCIKKSLEDLMKETYFTDSGRNITISFLTPTAFKSKGKYCNYPMVKSFELFSTCRRIFRMWHKKFYWDGSDKGS